MAKGSTRCISLLLLGVMLLGLGGSVRADAVSLEEQFHSPVVQSMAETTSISPLLTGVDCRATGLPEIACTGVSSNDEWTPVIREFDGVPMALVPAGCFTMGSTDEQINNAMDELFDRRSYYEDEQPAHEQCFAEPFWIDVYEVTNEQYGSYDVRPGDDLPRDYISWFDSAAHCESRGVRLPSEAEWEYAARGPDSLIFPWGNEFDNTLLNYCDFSCGSPGADTSASDGYALTGPVGSYPGGVSWVGALDMSGNLWEWTSGLPYDYPYRADDGREVDSEHDSSSFRTLRGGAWIDSAFALRSANRNRHAPVDQATIFGFRCASSLGKEKNAAFEETPAMPAMAFTFSAADCLAAGLPENACTGVLANDDWAPVIREFDGVPMVLVPAGCFTMGSTREQVNYAAGELLDRRLAYADEQPAHEQCFAEPFWIDVHEVTNEQYGSYGDSRGEDFPREEVSWFDSAAHCESRGARLPTEAEWEYASRGPDSLIFPWGNRFDGSLLNFCDLNCSADRVHWADMGHDDGYEYSAPVGSYPGGASWVGALDMSGNVWEWVSSLYESYPFVADDGRETGADVDSSSLRSVRGGSWHCPAHSNRSADRTRYAPEDITGLIGFRCARSLVENDNAAVEEPVVRSTLVAADCLAAGLPESACTGVSTNDEWVPVIWEFDGVPMVLVPAGCFLMGNDRGFAEEQPVHEMCFDQPFWIDLTEVTVAQFTQFLNGQDEPVDDVEGWLDRLSQIPSVPAQLNQQDHGWVPVPGHGKRPLQSVTQVGANAYCAWRASRLPTEAEWEYAARGPDSLLYPWGNEFIVDNVVRVHERTNVPAVGSKPLGASWVGALDLSSSLFERVSSLHRPYPYDAVDGREAGLAVDDSSDRVLRGSAWYHPDGMHDNVSATARFSAPPHYAAWYFGFRCARPINENDSTAAPESTARARFSAADCQGAGLPEMACAGVSTNEAWTPLVREFDGVPMALIPAGCFIMGSTDEQVDYAVDQLLDRRLVYANEQSAHRQCITEPFWIDVYEVTNEQYGSHGEMQGADRPREMVTWFEAATHCESRGARLPTEAEWGYAARGPDSLIFPWGNEFDASAVNFCDISCMPVAPWAELTSDDGYRITAPVGTYPQGVSWVGALDMSGNVWEWVSSMMYEYPYRRDDGREEDGNSDSSSLRALRGGSFQGQRAAMRAANRNEREPIDRSYRFGFRCVH